MKTQDYQVVNRLQLFPHDKGWAIFDEKTFRFSYVFCDVSIAFDLAKDIACKNAATLLVRDMEGEIILRTVYS